MFPQVQWGVSVPSFGDSFFMRKETVKCKTNSTVSVPSFGDSFFIWIEAEHNLSIYNTVSVPSFGDSFFMATHNPTLFNTLLLRFRPLIRGFFFYSIDKVCFTCSYRKVSVPSFGDSFFIERHLSIKRYFMKNSFRPLIRGFFFYNPHYDPETANNGGGVSVPSFGDSFFILISSAVISL